MEDKLNELEIRVNDLAMEVGGLVGRADEDGNSTTSQNDINELSNDNILELQERLAAAEKALATLSNTLHVIDATALLSLYSLIKTDNLRQPDFKSNQDIIDSGCSDAINRMMKTVIVVNNNEKKKNEEQTA